MSEYLKVLFAMRKVLLELLALARAEAWDDLIEALPKYNQQAANLPQIEWDRLSAPERATLETGLRELQALQEELTERSQSWHDELAASLQGLHNAGKLDKAYRL